MNRLPFYQVAKDAYLFPAILQTCPNQTLEEPVRQWCAYELIRAYGYPITSLEFERPVKVGSKTYGIDITVVREGRPWIVVECKEPNHSQYEKALEQGESYANALAIHAEYVLYTNGTKWLVRRKVKDIWLAIDDLPCWARSEAGRDLVEILESVYELKPLLFKLDESLAGLDAQCFLDHLQRFFIHSNPLLAAVDEEAIDASDHLLRALGDKKQHINYRVQKLNFARHNWEKFRSERSIELEIRSFDFDGRFRPLLGAFLSDLEQLLPCLVRPLTVEAQVLRLNIALLAYGLQNEGTKGEYLPLPPAIHQALRDLLNSVLVLRFHTQLPDIVEREANSQMKNYCEGAWLELRDAYGKGESL